EGDLPFDGHLVDRGIAGRVQPVFGNPVGQGLAADFRIVRIQEQVQLRLVQVLFVGRAGGRLDAVGIVEQNAQVADPPHAGLGTDRGHARLDARVAEDALFRLAGFPVVVDLLVRAGGDTHATAAGLVMGDVGNV